MQQITISANGRSYTSIDYRRVIGDRSETLPYSLRVLAENAAHLDTTGQALSELANRGNGVIPFRPARLLLQDMLGLPLLVDVLALSSLVGLHGDSRSKIDPTLPVDLVIDHSLTVEH